MESDGRKRWEQKHREAASTGLPPHPAHFLLEVQERLPRGGRALDLACGRGGNALFLAERGYPVEAVDRSFGALRELRKVAKEKSLPIETWVADLAAYPLLPALEDRYRVIVCFRYLERSIWHAMEKMLRPGGALVFETFTLLHRETDPQFPLEYCLGPRELLRAFPGLTVSFYRETRQGESAGLLAFRSRII